ncbi:ImmA/IrrE family metallo-endopeptidase [Corynebacterium sp. SCR221107]|uniref:ImmA/IrrE family metallo-endopeptidase n=1 Tax=Corynebacterium sp. SCR221107 TaxID=3017361 RepID=UPI0022EC81BB|nr:ImmA/IrrE family metallo-endopeptidase [Corynebacterium sp. SCR221107]WBT08817.1 ImmA/IrrE family metallo-endopeptidase [Corynebacterium sp. SCR221107]
MSAVEDRLEAMCERMGVKLIERPDLRVDLNACWHADSRSIVVRWGLDPVTRRCAIAHELGHADAGHDCSSPRAEREADEFAAKLLIDYDEVERIAHESGWAPSEICAELGVTPDLFEVWSRLYEAGKIDMYSWCRIY